MLAYYTTLIVLGLQNVLCASSTSAAALYSQAASGSQAAANNNGLCGEFISTCYSTCFASVKKSGLGHVPVVVGYTCKLSNTGQYSVACKCGSTDDTAAVLAALPTPLPTVTTTVAISKTTMNTIFTTSTATTLATVPFTTGTTVSTCSPLTVVNTAIQVVPTTTTYTTTLVVTLPAITVTSTTLVASTISAAVLTVPTPGANNKRDSFEESGIEKRSSAVFCNTFVLACAWGCGLEGSAPRYDNCQASMSTGRVTAACVCHNGNNLLQQALVIFNSGKPKSGQCSSLSGTTVAATATSTITSTVVSTALTTSVRVVTTTGTITTTKVLTSTVNYACPTTISTTITVPTTSTVEVTAYSTDSLQSTVTVFPTGYNIAIIESGTTNGFVASVTNFYHLAQPTSSSNGAAVFVPVLNEMTDTQYNLLGLNGDFVGKAFAAELDNYYPTPDQPGGFDVVFESLPMVPQGPGSGSGAFFGQAYQSALWLFDPDSTSPVLTCSYITANDAPFDLTIALEYNPDDGSEALYGATSLSTVATLYPGFVFTSVGLQLVPVF